jgi:hypothetical protein
MADGGGEKVHGDEGESSGDACSQHPPSRPLFAGYRGSRRRRIGSLDLSGNFGLQWPGSISHRSDEAVADPGDGFYIPGRGCRVTQRVAEFLDRFVQSVVKVDKDVRGPKALPEFIAGEYLAGTFQEHTQEQQWLLWQPEFGPIPAQLPGLEIELKEAKANYFLGRRNRHVASSVHQRELSLASAGKACIAFHNDARTGDNFV